MKSSSEFSPASSTAILNVGDPGSGKTGLGFALPCPGILDCDGNLAGTVRRIVKATGKVPEFKYSQPFKDDKEQEVPEVDRWKRAMAESAKLLVDPWTKSFFVDGLSNLCRWGLVHTEQELINSGINVKKEYLAKYQGFIPLLSNFITKIRVPGKLVFITVHQVADKDEVLGRTRFFLDIPGRLSDTLGGQFTDVWGMSSTPDPTNTKTMAKYEIRTKPTGFHVNLKTSLDLEPSINITDKTPAEIWKLLEPRLSYNVKGPVTITV
jgi:hypothetical protein